MANRVAGAKRHELRGPKRQDLYLPRGVIHPWRWRPVDYYDTRPYEDTRLPLPKRNFSSMRRQLVDYYGIRPMKRQDLYLPRGVIRTWDDNLSTTTVFDLWRDKISISQEELFIHGMTTCRLLRYSTQDKTRSPFPKRNYSSMRWQTNWLLRYSKTQIKVTNDKLREKATTRSVVNSKKTYYTSKC